jgi:hypothetical protein
MKKHTKPPAKLSNVVAHKVIHLDIDPGIVFDTLLKTYSQYIEVREQEKTKREAIAVREKIMLEEIEKRHQFMMKYLEKSFDERAKNFQQLFTRIDAALDKNDIQSLSSLLNTLTDLAKVCPIKALASLEQTRSACEDPDHVWEL